MPDTARVSDLTVDELMQLVRQAIREALTESGLVTVIHPSLDDFPVDDLGPWPEGLSLRREDMYGDAER